VISWQADKSNLALAGYRVYRAERLDTMQMVAVSRLISSTTFTDTTKNRSRRTLYAYTVKAVSMGGVESRFSSTVQAKLSSGRDVPVVPAYINALRKDNTVTIQWQNTKMDDNYIAGYNIYRKKIVPGEQLTYDVQKAGAIEAGRLGFIKLNKKPLDKPYYTDTLDKQETRYEYVVSATDITGGESGLTALAFDNSTDKISSPAQLVVMNINSSAKLNWQQPNTSGVTGYNVYRKMAGEKTFTKTANINAAQTSWTDTTISPKHTYVYRVKAIGNNGESIGYASQSLRVE
jgi:fibronectin type 3 domain-containing protein